MRHVGILALVVILFVASAQEASARLPKFRRADLPGQLKVTHIGGALDANRDGLTDLVVGSHDGVYVVVGSGELRFRSWFRVTEDALFVQRVEISDFDGDGHSDFVVGGYTDPDDAPGSRTVRVYLAVGEGSFLRVFETRPGVYGKTQVLTGDFDGDGNADFLVGGNDWRPTPPTNLTRPWGTLDVWCGNGAGGFDPAVRTIFPSGVDHYATMHSGDLNDDGRSDVITRSFYLDSFFVWYATEGGGFTGPLALPLPDRRGDALNGEPGIPTPRYVAAGDLDEDGASDLVVRFRYAGKDPTDPGYEHGRIREFTAIYSGLPGGGFSAAYSLEEPAEHERTTVDNLVLDVDEDGKLDILLTSPNYHELPLPIESNITSPVDLHPGNGDGTFASPVVSRYSGGRIDGRQLSKTLVDVDGDGRPDLVSRSASTIRVAPGLGGGRFGEAVESGVAQTFWNGGAVAADFNGDGRMDVAVANSGTYNLSIWLAEEGGAWSGPVTYETAPGDSIVALIGADFDADGDIDVAGASSGLGFKEVPGAVALYMNDGNGAFSPGPRFQTGVASDLVAADFDNDGKLDLAIGNADAPRVTMVFDVAGEAQALAFSNPLGIVDPIAAKLSWLAAGHFDGNGTLDLVRSDYKGTSDLFLDLGDPLNRRVASVDTGYGTAALAAGDATGDGLSDIVTSFFYSQFDLNNGYLRVWPGDGAGGFAPVASHPLGAANTPFAAAVADLAGDGFNLVVFDECNTGLSLFRLDDQGHVLEHEATAGCMPGLRKLAIADMDGDGLLDIVRPDAVFYNLGVCGDGKVDPGEQCDDGGVAPCDGCSDNCLFEQGFLCGDGLVAAHCGEQCDDGENNDDLAADACRTDCQEAHCGDGVIDDAEECDDGNLRSCDGCSAFCTIDPVAVCGDGIVDRSCGEFCDDANAIVGDGCSATCEYELIHGGGNPRTDCWVQWQATNPVNHRLYDRRGGMSSEQSCSDNDPACDFDGGTPGSCTFRLALCSNVMSVDLPDCTSSTPGSWSVRRPSAKHASRSNVDSTLRTALLGMGATLPSGSYGTCSQSFDIVVPLRARGQGWKAAKKKVDTSLEDTRSGRNDRDRLKLVCLP